MLFLNQRKGENDRRKYLMINLHERMLPTSAGVEPATSWSPVGRSIQVSHRGQLIRRCCMRHLIRTYMVWELIYQIWDRQSMLIKTKKKRKKTGAFKRCILLSLSVKVTFDLLDMLTAPGVLQSRCIHTCHTNGLIIRLPLLMIRVNRLFTAQRTVKC